MCSCRMGALRIASFTTMSSCDSFSFSVANRKAGLSAPETPLLARAAARRFAAASRAPPQPAIRSATRWRQASSARASTASSTCRSTIAQSPWIRMSVGNPHIGKSDFRGSISIWIHLMAPARLAYCGMNGTSESSSRPRSACSSKGRGSKPAKHGESCEILRSIELNSATLMPQVRASCSSTATASGLRPR